MLPPMSEKEVNEKYKQIKAQQKSKTIARKRNLTKGHIKELVVKFRSARDAQKFAKSIHQNIKIEAKCITYDPLQKGVGRFIGEPAKPLQQFGLDAFYQKHWVGMPEFEQENSKWEWHRLRVGFRSWDAYKAFAVVVRQFLKKTTSTIYYPKWLPADLKNRVWKSTLPASKKITRYPIYVVSKGRAYSRLTSKALEAMGLPYFIVVEPQDYEDYATVIDKKKILKLPEDTNPEFPTGPGRARNFCRDHSWLNGHQRHFVLDDNIEGFYRLHKNRRFRVADGAIFRAAEDFVDRYSNILVAGFQYRFFCASKSKYPPFVTNTRIYSCLLIDNRILFKWKRNKRLRDDEIPVAVKAKKTDKTGAGLFLWHERYNEDTILSLDAMENGFATVQFNAFLQGKSGTQKLAGGNSDLFYIPEQVNEKSTAENRFYNEGGTIRKSLTLEKCYPSVARMVWKFNRPHHEVNYSKYKNIPLKRKSNIKTNPAVNYYGMKLVREA